MNEDADPPFDRRDAVERAVGMVGAMLRKDREGFYVLGEDFPGGCPAALAAVVRVTESFIRIVSKRSGLDPQQVFQELALGIVNGLLDEEDD